MDTSNDNHAPDDHEPVIVNMAISRLPAFADAKGADPADPATGAAFTGELAATMVEFFEALGPQLGFAPGHLGVTVAGALILGNARVADRQPALLRMMQQVHAELPGILEKAEADAMAERPAGATLN